MWYPPRDSWHSWQAAARRTSAGPLGAAFPAPTYAEQRGTTKIFAVPHSDGHRLRSPSISTFYTGFYTVLYRLYRFIHFLDRHGQNMDKFNRSQLPNCQSVLRQVTLAAGSGGSTEAFVAFVAVAFVLVVFAASQRTSEEAKVRRCLVVRSICHIEQTCCIYQHI